MRAGPGSLSGRFPRRPCAEPRTARLRTKYRLVDQGNACARAACRFSSGTRLGLEACDSKAAVNGGRDSSVRSLPRDRATSPERRESSGKCDAPAWAQGQSRPGRRRAGPQGPGTILSRRGRRSIPILAVRGYEVGGLGSWSPSGRRFFPPLRRLSGRPRQAPRCTPAVGNEAFGGSRTTSVPFASPRCGAACWPGPPKTSSLAARFLRTARNLPGRAPQVRGPLPTSVAPPCFL